jgi:TadE-like protein
MATQSSRKRRGQSMVEFALVAPLLFLVLLVTLDFARLVYTFGVMTSAARDGARSLSLKVNQTSDCAAYFDIEGLAQGFQLSPDPSSIAGDHNPNAPSGPPQPTTPPPGQGYIYIWPSVASSTPQDQHPGCDGGARFPTSSTLHDVAVEIQYTYQPLLPVFQEFTGSFTIKAVSVVHTEYN